MRPERRQDQRIFLTTDAVGGVWTHTLDVARGFAARGALVDLAVLGPPPDDARRALADAISGVTLIPTNEPLEWCLPGPEALERCAERLAGLAADRGATAVHLHSPALMGQAVWPAPVLAAVHSCVATWWRAVRGNEDLPESLAWQAAATRRGLNRAAMIVAPSRAFAGALRDAYELQRPVTVVPNGGRAFPVEPAASRSGVLAAGRLWDEGKNIAAVDRAAARLGMAVLAAGALAGPNGTAITLSHAMPLGQMNPAPLARLMARLAVFAAPAFYEPFGLAILEAAHCGMALVLGDIPTLRELWQDAALFVDPGDDAALAASIAHLHAAPDFAAAMGAKARARAARYPVEAMVSALWDLHARLAVPALEMA